MHDGLGAEGVLEDVVGRREGRGRIAAPELKVEREVRIAHALQMLEVGKGAGRLEDVVHDRLGRRRLDLVEDRGQLLVLGDDLARRLLGDVRIARQHHRNRLAEEADLLEREHELLVVKGRPVVRVRQDGKDIAAGDDARDTFDGEGLAHVDALDLAVRDGATEDLSVEHPGKAQVRDVLGRAADLGACLEPRNGASDLRALFDLGRH